MKKTTFALALLLATTGLALYTAQAETLLIDAISEEPANASGGLPRPVKGMTMARVQSRFGAPEFKHAPVGTPGSRHQPPITRWTYPQFTVYFENRHVVNTVIHRAKK